MRGRFQDGDDARLLPVQPEQIGHSAFRLAATDSASGRRRSNPTRAGARADQCRVDGQSDLVTQPGKAFLQNGALTELIQVVGSCPCDTGSPDQRCQSGGFCFY